jgi:hypothetical protein
MDDFAKYLYLPRVKNAQVILDATQDGVILITWSKDTFAYADYYDANAGRYRGLDSSRRPTVQMNATSVVVKPEVAAAQIEKDSAPPPAATTGDGTGSDPKGICSIFRGDHGDSQEAPSFRSFARC